MLAAELLLVFNINYSYGVATPTVDSPIVAWIKSLELLQHASNIIDRPSLARETPTKTVTRNLWLWIPLHALIIEGE